MTMQGQLAFPFEQGEPGPELPRYLREWLWRCQRCTRHPPIRKPGRELRPPSCRKCGAEMSKVAFVAGSYETYQPLERAIRDYEERLAEDRRRIEILCREDPEFARRWGFMK